MENKPSKQFDLAKWSFDQKSSFGHYNPFNNSGAVERIIVECLLDDEDIKVSLMADNWHSDFSSRIAQQGIVVTCLKTNQAELARFLNQITVEPVFAGYLKVYPRSHKSGK